MEVDKMMADGNGDGMMEGDKDKKDQEEERDKKMDGIREIGKDWKENWARFGGEKGKGGEGGEDQWVLSLLVRWVSPNKKWKNKFV